MGVGLIGHDSLAAYSAAIPGRQNHFPEGPGAPNPAARRLLLGHEDLQSKSGPAQVPGLQRRCG